MARKNEFGKFIIAAGEVGQYSVCPEAWRLKVVERIVRNNEAPPSIQTGNTLHENWARELDSSAYLLHGLRVAIALVIAMIAIAFLYQ